MSSSVRSYVSDHRCELSATFSSCTEMRTRSPALRTLPSSTVDTSSRAPIVARSSRPPRNWNDDVRATTRRPRIRASTLISSSARPSEKYSSPGSALRFANGSTAIEARRSGAAAAADATAPCSTARRSRRSSWQTSSADAGRSRGAFARQRATRRSKSAGSSGRERRSGVGVSRRIAELTSTGLSPANGRRPAASSYSTTPSANRSVRASTAWPRSCSGAMYGSVPSSCPTPESGVETVALSEASLPPGASSPTGFARPKSSTFTRPSRVSITFAGFRSRCTTPFSWAADSASAMVMPRSTTRATGRPPGVTCWSSPWPSTSSMVRNRKPSASSTVNSVTMLGWLSAATVRASRSKRARRSGCDATSAGSTLSATSRPSRASRARYTSPMPPAPRSATIS